MQLYSTLLLILGLLIKTSQQSCTSTVAVTTCTWDTLKSTTPLQFKNYKSYLSFSRGNLEHLPIQAFKFFPEITILQLSHNKIKRLEDNSFEGLAGLKQLNLYDNQLSTVNENTLKHCVNLEKLDLGMNKISSIHDEAFGHLKSLKYLNLAFNSLKNVPVAVNSLTKLQILRLDNNAIDTLKPMSFSKLANLEELQMNDNKLMVIQQNAFQGLIRLNKLDLRSNYLIDLNVNDLVEDARNLNFIGLSLNSFNCENLRKILERAGKFDIEVPRGANRGANSVHGISCKNS